VWSGSRRLKNPSWSHRLPVRATLKLELYNSASFSLIVGYRKRSSFRASEPTPSNPPVLSAPVFRFLRSSVGVSVTTADATYSHSSLGCSRALRGNSLLLGAVAGYTWFMRIFPASDLGPGQGFEQRVCPVPSRIEVAAVKRYQRARGFENRVRLIR
jgi:hypothetical protein